MKPTILLLTALVLLFAPSLHAEDRDEVLRVLVPDMSCAYCSSSVTQALGKLDGVGEVAISLKSKVALLHTSAELDDTAVKKAVKKAGYEATKIERLAEDWKQAKKNIDKKAS